MPLARGFTQGNHEDLRGHEAHEPEGHGVERLTMLPSGSEEEPLMDERDLAPVEVFAGAYTQAIVLQSMLEAEAIRVSLVTPFLGGIGPQVPLGNVGSLPRLMVRREDAARARELVQAFLRADGQAQDK